MAAAQAIAVNQAGNGGGSHQVIEEVRSQILNNNNYCLRISVQALVTLINMNGQPKMIRPLRTASVR